MQALASPARRFHENTKETAAKVKEKVKALQLEEKKVSAAQLYLYAAATYLLIAIIACWGVVQVLKLLARIEVVWWLTRSAQLDDFRLWTNEVCLEPWHKERCSARRWKAIGLRGSCCAPSFTSRTRIIAARTVRMVAVGTRRA